MCWWYVKDMVAKEMRVKMLCTIGLLGQGRETGVELRRLFVDGVKMEK